MPASMKHLTDKKLNLTSLLARWKDGLYYTAAIVKCEKSRGRCLVCFEDGSELWIHKRDLHIQLTPDQIGEPDDIVCCVCDEDDSEKPNVIVLCDICNQAYHQKCHRPEIDNSVLDHSDDHDWICATCSYILNQSNPSKLVNNLQQQQPKQSKQTTQHVKHIQQSDQQSREKVKPKLDSTSGSIVQKQTTGVKEGKVKPETSATSASPSTITSASSAAAAAPKTTPKVTPTPTLASVDASSTKTQTIPPQKQPPYYPLSGQVRAATSSTAALASMTASSASIVGSPAGRTKQDIVNQSNRSSQRHQQLRQPGNIEIISTPPPVKHAVRKSSVNFSLPPVRQSALPTATRSIPSSVGPPAKMPRLVADTASPTSITPIGTTKNLTPTVTATIVEHKQPSPQQVTISNNSGNSSGNRDILAGSTVRLIPRQTFINPQGNIMNKSLNHHSSSPRLVEISPVAPVSIATPHVSDSNDQIVNSSPTTTTSAPISNNNNDHNRGGVIVFDSSSVSTMSSSHSSPQQSPNTLSDGGTKASHPIVIVSVDPKRKDNST